jgi:lipoprotein-releasing system ATP-binding protein
MTSRPIISARGLSKAYRIEGDWIPVLHNLTFDVYPHEFVTVAGVSGSGKSTLIHLLAGLELPSGGDLEVGGRRTRSMDEAWRAQFRNKHIGVIYQKAHLLPDLSLLENIALPLYVGRTRWGTARKEALAWLKRTGLSHLAKKSPENVTGEYRQTVSVLRATIQRPEIILADEPTGNLDHAASESILEVLLALKAQQDSTLVLASHDLRIVARGDRIFGLHRGELVEYLGSKDVASLVRHFRQLK